MKLKEAINRQLADYENVNVSIYARPVSYEGSQARFDLLQSDAIIALENSGNDDMVEFWGLGMVEWSRTNQQITEQGIVDLVHSFYRVNGITNPF
jgi:hypothetical protein